LISVEGLNFDSFLPLFGDKGLKIPVALLTDADPVAPKPAKKADGAADPGGAAAVGAGNPPEDEDDDAEPMYPAPGDVITVSANTAKMKACEDAHVKVFHGLKTFEYDLALEPSNREPMLAALMELHPKIAAALTVSVNAAPDDAAKAKALFCGMFERPGKNVQKGSFAQALAQVIADPNLKFTVPAYIQAAIKHACQATGKP
jgi:putative ATP-dependent endonuclease of the OLD family